MSEREQIVSRLSDLQAKQEAATGWGAAVGAREEEIRSLESRLLRIDSMTAPPSTETPRHTADPFAMNAPNLRRRAQAVYLACDEGPASDISAALLWAADEIECLASSHASLTARVAELEAAILFWRMARYPENRPDPHDIEGRCLVQASLDLAESTLYQMSLKVAALDNADGGRGA